MFRRGVQPLFT